MLAADNRNERKDEDEPDIQKEEKIGPLNELEKPLRGKTCGRFHTKCF